MKKHADQLPLFLPESTWITPSIPDLSAAREVAIDTETRDGGLSAGRGPGWATGDGHLCGVSVAWEGGSAYLPLAHPDSETIDHYAAREFLLSLYQRTNLKLIFMNAPYDLGWIWNEFRLLPPNNSERIDDINAMAVMVDENRPSGGYTLDEICKWQGLPGKDERMLVDVGAAHGFTGRALKQNLWRLPARFVGPYAEMDAAQTLAVAPKLRVIMEREGTTAAYQTEADLIACCFEMRRRGIRVDKERVERGIANFTMQRKNLLAEISEQLCRRVGLEEIRSPKWMEAVCAEEGIPVPRTQPKKDREGRMKGGGNPSFTAEWMRTSEHWLPRMACQVDRLSEAADKFLSGYILGYEHEGRIHPTINQFRGEGGGTRSHRFSFADPPLQQAPGSALEETDELGAEIVSIFRGAFLPEEGELWCSPDYNSQEYRLIVHYAEIARQKKRIYGDPESWLDGYDFEEWKLPRAEEAGNRYRNDPDTDFHQLVADMTGLSRYSAKQVNFAKAFGAGISKFAAMSEMSVEQAKKTMDQYDEKLPFVKEEARLCQKLAAHRGYIKLIDGARSHFDLWERDKFDDERQLKLWSPALPLIEAQRAYPGCHIRRAFTHKAMNRLIQGSAARQTKLAMLAMWREGIVPLLQIHDELPVSCDGPERGAHVAYIMRDVVKLSVPVKVDVKYGTSWGTARKVKNSEGRIAYDASWKDADRLRREGRWW